MTITDFHTSLKEGKISARQVAHSCLQEIEKMDGDIHAFLEVFKEDALSQATKIDERIQNGEAQKLLWGVPFAVKDNILIRGKIASAASKILKNYVASYDATVIQKLREAGAIFLGRTNMDEFAMGSSTENSSVYPTRNPRDLKRVPGGSSGGSAAAVASHMALAGLGSDTGGSIRQPAAFCGIVGLKPTYGSVSRSGLIAMASSFDQIGPLAQTVEDAKIVFHVIKGKDSLDSTSVDAEAPLQEKARLSVKTIGVPKEYFGEGLDKHIKTVIETMIKKLEKHYEIREISLPHTVYALPCYYIIVPAEVSSNMARLDGIRYGVRKERHSLSHVYSDSRGEGLGIEVRRRILLGTYVLSHGYYEAYYSHAQKVRSLIREDFRKAFDIYSGGVDVILGPTTPTLPFRIGEKVRNPLAMYLEDIYTVPVNLAGIPALSLPVGEIEDEEKSFPVGAQLIGPHFSEEKLFEVGNIIESLRNI